MNIDIFKDTELWGKLRQYNQEIIDIYNKDGGKGSTHWFDPKCLARTVWMRKSNKPGKFFYKDLKQPNNWKLVLHPSNYLNIFLANLLYQDRKGVLIEDVCSGAGRLSYYLSKLGFNNFSFIDDFSGVTKGLFDAMREKSDPSKYILNQKETKPVISNLANFPWYSSHYTREEDNPSPPKGDDVPLDSCELFTFYCANAIFVYIGKYLLENGYVELCQDEDYTQVAFCKKEKHDEFTSKIEKYKC